jgi:hypothetical protein
MTHDVGNPDPGLEQEQKWGGVKPVNGIPTHSWIFYSVSSLKQQSADRHFASL